MYRPASWRRRSARSSPSACVWGSRRSNKRWRNRPQKRRPMPKRQAKANLFDKKNRPLIISRKDASRIHFTNRIQQRFRTTPTTAELQQITRGIQLGRAHKVTNYDQKRNLYVVAFRGKLVGVVFDWTLNQLVTILPDEDPRIEAVAKQPGRALTKWLQETRTAAKEAA